MGKRYISLIKEEKIRWESNIELYIFNYTAVFIGQFILDIIKYYECKLMGTLKIIDASNNAGIKPPIWEISEHTVKLTFFGNIYPDGATQGVKKKLGILLKAIATNEGKKAPHCTLFVPILFLILILSITHLVTKGFTRDLHLPLIERFSFTYCVSR